MLHIRTTAANTDRTWTTKVLVHNTNKKKMNWDITCDGVVPSTGTMSLPQAANQTIPKSEVRLPEFPTLSPYPSLTKKKSDEGIGIRAWILSHTPSVLAQAKRSHRLPVARICCTKHHIPQSASNSHVLSIFLQGLRTTLGSSPCLPTIFNPYPVSQPLPTTIIELETIQKDLSHTRNFSHSYFALLPMQDENKSYMYPDESFAAVSVARLEEAIRGKRGKETLTTEWVTRDEIASERMFWRCETCECGYWVRVMEVAETSRNWNVEDTLIDDTWAIMSEVRTQGSRTETLELLG